MILSEDKKLNSYEMYFKKNSLKLDKTRTNLNGLLI